MANKTIPELGQVFTATDLDYLVITNSGETITSKIQRQDLLSGTSAPAVFKSGDGTNSVVNAYDDATDAPHTKDYVIGGDGNYISYVSTTEGNTNTLLGGVGNYIVNQSSLSPGSGRGSVIAGGAGSYINHKSNAANSFIAASSGAYIDAGYGNNAIIATGAASYITGNAYHFIGGGRGNKITGTDDNALIGGNSNRVDGNYGFIGGGTSNYQRGNNSVILGGSSNQVSANKHQVFIGGGISNTGAHTNAAMTACSGRTTQYDLTHHSDNIFIWGHTTYPNTVTTTVSNQQTFNANNGRIQYTDVAAGNLNLIFTNIRNGEDYRWVIDNQTGGSITINSTSVPAGFTFVDDAPSGNVASGIHTFFVTVINNLVVVGRHA